jgi:hypothetical protein
MEPRDVIRPLRVDYVHSNFSEAAIRGDRRAPVIRVAALRNIASPGEHHCVFADQFSDIDVLLQFRAVEEQNAQMQGSLLALFDLPDIDISSASDARENARVTDAAHRRGTTAESTVQDPFP